MKNVWQFCMEQTSTNGRHCRTPTPQAFSDEKSARKFKRCYLGVIQFGGASAFLAERVVDDSEGLCNMGLSHCPAGIAGKT